MAALLDIVGSALFGGLLLLIAITATDTATQEFINYHSDSIVQENLTQMSRMLEYDLRKMGFGIPEAQMNSILQIGQPNRLRFITQLNLDPDSYTPIPGVVGFDDIPDTIEYRITWADTTNFLDTTIVMYNVNRRLATSTGVTESTDIGRIGNNNVFRYLDQIGRQTGVLMATRMVEVTLTAFNPQIMLSPEMVRSDLRNIQDREFRKRELRRLLRASYWRQTRLVSKNLRR